MMRLVAITLLVFGLHASEALGREVTEADIEAARSSAPTVTEDDIRRAQEKYAKPPAAASPRPAMNVDAIPVPITPAEVDLGALAERFRQLPSATPEIPTPALVIFLSFSLPEPTLVRLIAQAERLQAKVVIRGLHKESLKETVAATRRLIGVRRVAVDIDPQAFTRFGVLEVPSFVAIKAGASLRECGSGACIAPDAFALVAGDVSAEYALEYIARRQPDLQRTVQAILERPKVSR